jgi:hypothetical protein
VAGGEEVESGLRTVRLKARDDRFARRRARAARVTQRFELANLRSLLLGQARIELVGAEFSPAPRRRVGREITPIAGPEERGEESQKGERGAGAPARALG